MAFKAKLWAADSCHSHYMQIDTCVVVHNVCANCPAVATCRASNSLPSNVLGAAIVYTVGSITIPSLASVYNEMALKKNMDTSVHIQNFYLYFFGVLFNLLGLALLVVVGHQSISELFNGYSKVMHCLREPVHKVKLAYTDDQSAHDSMLSACLGAIVVLTLCACQENNNTKIIFMG